MSSDDNDLEDRLHLCIYHQQDEINELKQKLESVTQERDAARIERQNWKTAYASAEKELDDTKLQVSELQKVLWEIGNKDVSEPFSRDDAMKILSVLNKTGFTKKRSCACTLAGCNGIEGHQGT